MLPAAFAVADVVIRYGSVPTGLTHPIAGSRRHQIAGGECLLDIDGVARYWLRGGGEVVVARAPGADDGEVRAFVLSSVMGVLSHQHGFLPLHASAVDVGGACVLFAGRSGNGKSTLAAACHARGYRVLSDDLSAVSLNDHGQPIVHAGYRVVKLWSDALDHLGGALGEARPLPGVPGKHGVALPGGAPAGPLPLRSVFALVQGDAPELELDPLAGQASVALLRRETYRKRFMLGLGLQLPHFSLVTAVARAAPSYLVRRPAGLANIDRLIDRLAGHDWVPGGPAGHAGRGQRGDPLPGATGVIDASCEGG
jgi:hypothetical protein